MIATRLLIAALACLAWLPAADSEATTRIILPHQDDSGRFADGATAALIHAGHRWSIPVSGFGTGAQISRDGRFVASSTYAPGQGPSRGQHALSLWQIPAAGPPQRVGWWPDIFPCFVFASDTPRLLMIRSASRGQVMVKVMLDTLSEQHVLGPAPGLGPMDLSEDNAWLACAVRWPERGLPNAIIVSNGKEVRLVTRNPGIRNGAVWSGTRLLHTDRNILRWYDPISATFSDFSETDAVRNIDRTRSGWPVSGSATMAR